MPFHPIRPISEPDYVTLKPRLLAFAKRHGIAIDESTMADANLQHSLNTIREAIECEVMFTKPHLKRNYEQVIARATNEPHATGIAWGYVGYSSKY